MFAALLAGSPHHAQAAWKTGERFRESLHQKVSVTWDKTPLRDAISRLADSQSVAIFLDRRVNPQIEVTVQLDNIELDRVIRTIAQQYGLGVGYVGSVIYVGPPMAAARVATLSAMKLDEAKELNETLSAKLTKAQYLQWPRLSEPRWIVRKLAAEAGVSISDAETIPHDLWPAYQMPELSTCERLTLVLANFGLTFHVDETNRQMTLAPMPRAVAVQRSYTTKLPIDQEVGRLEKKFPQAIIQVADGEIVVRSTAEDQWAIADLLTPVAPREPKPASPESQRFTLTAKDQPLGWLSKQVGKRVGLTVEFDPEVQSELDQRVSFSVEKVTLEELFRAIVEPAGLSVTLDDKVIRIDKR